MNVYEGDTWKNTPTPVETHNPTRAQEQARIDTEYYNGRMGLAEWRTLTDELSEPTKWCGKGRL